MILYQRIPTQRSLPKTVLKEAWRVQRDERSQRRAGIGKSVADEEDKFKIDFRVQGVPNKAALEDEGRTNRIQKLAHILETHSRTDALITDLQKTVFKPFSEESKRTTHNLGKIDLFELDEVSAKTQRPSCAKYWLTFHLRTMLIAVRKAKNE